MLWLDPRLDLPRWLVAGLGRIAAEWSELEWQFEDAIRISLQTDVKLGRIAVTGMNMRSRVICLTNLLKAWRLDSLHDRFVKIGTEITNHRESERNRLVHGLWAKVAHNWYVIRTSGAGTREVEPFGKVTRAVLPQMEKITRRRLVTIRSQIRALRWKMIALRKELEAALPPSPHKSPRQLRLHYQRLAHTKKVPPIPPDA
jgi:hypothetical protein